MELRSNVQISCGRSDKPSAVRHPAFRAQAMPQPSEAKYLYELTEVPAGWPLPTVIDAFLRLAAYRLAQADRAREALSQRLAELCPEEAEAWLERCREHFAKEINGKATRREKLYEALLLHGAAEWGKYSRFVAWRFSEAGLLRGELRPAAERERRAAWYLQKPYIRDRCRELAERLEQAESQETARKRQKLEEETAERKRRLEVELQTSQSRELSNRLASAEAEVSSKEAELQTAQSDSAKCKERCEELATRAAAAEATAAEVRQELRQLQGEHGKCQERCQELANRLEAEAAEHATTKERLSQAESDAAERRLELQRLQEESRGYQERCQQVEVHAASAEEPGSKAELQLEKEKAVLQERCEQLQQQLQQTSSKAEAERSAMLGQLLDLREEKGMYEECIRELERQLREAKKQEQESHHSNYLVDEDRASILSGSSQSSVKSVKQNCFMLDALFKVRMDVLREGREKWSTCGRVLPCCG